MKQGMLQAAVRLLLLASSLSACSSQRSFDPVARYYDFSWSVEALEGSPVVQAFSRGDTIFLGLTILDKKGARVLVFGSDGTPLQTREEEGFLSFQSDEHEFVVQRGRIRVRVVHVITPRPKVADAI